MYRVWCGITALLIGNEVRKDMSKKDNANDDDVFNSRHHRQVKKISFIGLINRFLYLLQIYSGIQTNDKQVIKDMSDADLEKEIDEIKQLRSNRMK